MKIDFRAGECYLCLMMCDIVVVISFPRKGKETSKAGEGILSEIFFLVYSVSRKNPLSQPAAVSSAQGMPFGCPFRGA